MKFDSSHSSAASDTTINETCEIYTIYTLYIRTEEHKTQNRLLLTALAFSAAAPRSFFPADVVEVKHNLQDVADSIVVVGSEQRHQRFPGCRELMLTATLNTIHTLLFENPSLKYLQQR